MGLKINNNYHGFKLLEEREIKEISSKGRIFEHEKSGARLLHLENDDDNKTFTIGFRTPPVDSSGVAHVLEHIVLLGSKKFPTKCPLSDYKKGSLLTYSNGVTYEDITFYPLASKNEKDFFNLMDITLAGIFYPNIYDKPEMLMEQGWHYEIDNKEDKLEYNGVVLNEMIDSFSETDYLLQKKSQQSLFPDTTYGKCSDGEPEYITTLTQEKLFDFHSKYYHPSNSYMVLYGNEDVQKVLEFLNKEYLVDFNKIEMDSRVRIQKPFSEMKEETLQYPISKEESEENKTYFSLNFVIGENKETERTIAFDILKEMLINSEASPLKKALLESGLCEDVDGEFNRSIIQPVFSVIAKGCNIDKKEKFREVVLNALKEIVKSGIDQKLIESSINKTRFELSEADNGGFPKGAFYFEWAMENWIYDKSPFEHIEYEKATNKIKSGLNTKYFENLIEKYLLNNTHSSLVVLEPKKGLSEEKALKLEEKLEKYKESLSEEELDKIIEQTKRLKELQNTPESKEALKSIPKLSIDDIKNEVQEIPTFENEELGTKILHHKIATNKIAYIDFLFDASVIPQDKIPYISLLGEILGKIDTTKSEYEDLSNEINIHTGGIEFSTEVYEDELEIDKYYPKFKVRGKAISEKISKLMEFLSEIVSSTSFEDKNRLKELIVQVRSEFEEVIEEDGNDIVRRKVASYYSKAGAYVEKVSGLDFYNFMCDLEEDIDNKIEKIVYNLKEVYTMIFNKNNLIVSVTGEENEYKQLRSNLNVIIDSLNNQVLDTVEYIFEDDKKNEGLLTADENQCIAKGYNFKKLGYKYNGKFVVLNNILFSEYILNKIRIEGGAYWAYFEMFRNGNVEFWSYADPNLEETLNVFDGAGEFIKNFDITEEDMEKYIIGAIGELNVPEDVGLHPCYVGERATKNYIVRSTKESRQRERDEVLSTTAEDIKSFGNMLTKITEQNCYCVIGDENKIKENEDVFESLLNVFK